MIHSGKSRCTNEESLPRSPTTERLPKSACTPVPTPHPLPLIRLLTSSPAPDDRRTSAPTASSSPCPRPTAPAEALSARGWPSSPGVLFLDRASPVAVTNRLNVSIDGVVEPPSGFRPSIGLSSDSWLPRCLLTLSSRRAANGTCTGAMVRRRAWPPSPRSCGRSRSLRRA